MFFSVLVAIDRYLNIHQPMRYNMIMKGMRGWRIILLAWIFCFCMGVIVYASTNLIENHECTYVFSVVKVIIFTIINQRNKWKIRLIGNAAVKSHWKYCIIYCNIRFLWIYFD